MLVGADPVDADPLDVAQRPGQSDRVGDVPGARLELVGRPLIERSLQPVDLASSLGDTVAGMIRDDVSRTMVEVGGGAVEENFAGAE